MKNILTLFMSAFIMIGVAMVGVSCERSASPSDLTIKGVLVDIAPQPEYYMQLRFSDGRVIILYPKTGTVFKLGKKHTITYDGSTIKQVEIEE